MRVHRVDGRNRRAGGVEGDEEMNELVKTLSQLAEREEERAADRDLMPSQRAHLLHRADGYRSAQALEMELQKGSEPYPHADKGPVELTRSQTFILAGLMFGVGIALAVLVFTVYEIAQGWGWL